MRRSFMAAQIVASSRPGHTRYTVAKSGRSGPSDWQADDHGEIVCHCEMVARREIEATLTRPLPPGDFGGLRGARVRECP
jgi:hypothetical protein